MKLILFFIIFVGLSSAHEYENGRPNNLNCNCGWKNGNNEKITHPWVVQILTKTFKEFICAATIMTKWHVLTTADCVDRHTHKTIVVCTGSELNKECEFDGKLMTVDYILIAKGFRSSISKNNVALVVTVDPIGFDQFSGPACFPHAKVLLNDNIVGTELLFVGWGGSKRVRRKDFEVTKKEACTSMYDNFKNEMHICALPRLEQNIRDDFGGTYVELNRETSRYTVIGVVDVWLKNIGNPLYPTLVTNFTLFRDWVKDKVKCI